MQGLSSNPNIIPEFIEKHPYGIGGKSWNMEGLSLNISITPEFIEKHPDWKWNAFCLSLNESISPEFMEKHCEGYELNFKLAIQVVSANPNITPEFIERHLDWNWDTDCLSRNTFDKAIKEDEEKYKVKLYFLSGEYKNKDGSLFNFRNNILFDPNLNKLIFSYL